jgi:hypothetical protein
MCMTALPHFGAPPARQILLARYSENAQSFGRPRRAVSADCQGLRGHVLDFAKLDIQVP